MHRSAVQILSVTVARELGQGFVQTLRGGGGKQPRTVYESHNMFDPWPDQSNRHGECGVHVSGGPRE